MTTATHVSSVDLVRRCERVEVTRIVVKEGAGIEGDPVREVAYWYADDGQLIARRDSWEENETTRCATSHDVAGGGT